MEKANEGLAKLREPFPENQVSKLPKGGTYLSYVGHAALTDRLLDADPMWDWEPMAYTPEGLPLFDASGGLWIKLTVCGVTRLGYGHAKAKTGPGMEPGTREKEVIGDALRNAGMRFGAALDLWHKGELHAAKEEVKESLVANALDYKRVPKAEDSQDQTPEELAVFLLAGFENCMTLEQVDKTKDHIKAQWGKIKHITGIKDSVVACAANATTRINHIITRDQVVSEDYPEPGSDG